MARPSIFTQELADDICRRIVEGESVRAICQDEEMPHLVSVYRWLAKDEAFCKQYAQAKADQAEKLADEIIEIADAAKAEDVQVAKLRVDSRKWVAARLLPKKYGDSVHQKISAPDGGPVEHKHAHELSREELMRIAGRE